jgi:hypothetical protein
MASEDMQQPKCPGCGKQPLKFAHDMPIAGNGAIVFITWCADCGHVLSMQFVGQAQPDGPPRIVRPS